jgi:hypothetical protein
MTPEEQNHIREEELFRERVRSELERERLRSTPRGLWSFLNSPFVLFLLSTIAVGLISTAYALVQERIRIRTEQQAVISRIETEINNRLSGTARAVRSALSENALMGLYNALETDSRKGGTYLEFKERSLDSLVGEFEARSGQTFTEVRRVLDELGAIHMTIWKSGIFKDTVRLPTLTIGTDVAKRAHAAVTTLEALHVSTR